jgi:peptide/nickel transport system ATP-binding protein
MQRLMIARIFLINPSILIADEPTSMIDACSAPPSWTCS